MKMNLLVLTLTLGVLDLALAYPFGAPPEACENMMPGHFNATTSQLIQPQNGMPYFSIHVSKSESVWSGEAIEVTIHADQHYFEGFLIKAQMFGIPIGKFETYMGDTQTACNGNAVTHSEHKHYDSAKFLWMAPDVEEPTSFEFVATVVKGYSTYFMGVRSKTITVIPSNTNGQTRLAPATTLPLLMIAMATKIFRK